MEHGERDYFEEKFNNLHRMIKDHSESHNKEHLRIDKKLDSHDERISTLSKLVWSASGAIAFILLIIKFVK